MRIVAALVIYIVCVTCANAQSLNLYNIDTSGYPTIRADYVATDSNFKLYKDLTASDFQVVERLGDKSSIDLSATVRQGCIIGTPDSAASLIIIIDLSGSMTHRVNGVARIEIAKRALRLLISQLSFDAGTQVCIIGFSARSRMVCPWSNDPITLINAINSMATGGGTNYEEPFTGFPNIFDEFLKRDPLIPKTAIFITDGRPSPPIADPDAFVDSTAMMAFMQSIILHSVSIDLVTTYEPLEELCGRTGGTSYVGPDAVLEAMISAASGAASSRTTCYIEWESPRGCGPADRLRTAFVTLKKDSEPKDTVPYTSSLQSITLVEQSTPVLNFGMLSSNEVAQASVTLTPTSYDWRVIGHEISPAGKFEVIHWDYPSGDTSVPTQSRPLVFMRGQPRTLRVKFKQDAVAEDHLAELRLIGDECSLIQPMRAGAAKTTVTLKTPNGGEVFTTCNDTVDIKWSGIAPTAEVDIQWSVDGITWNDIAKGATGNHYRWVPTDVGTTLKIRIQHIPLGHHAWLHHIGHTGADSLSSITVSPVTQHTFVTGWYNGSTQFGNGLVHNPIGAIDGFCQEIDTNGNTVRTFLLTGSKFKNEKIVGAVTDKAGNVYITGWFESEVAMFTNGRDTIMLEMPRGIDNEPTAAVNSFLVKVNPLGVPLWVRYAAGLPSNPGRVRTQTIGIREDSTGPAQIVIGGMFEQYLYLGITKSGQYLQLGPGLPLGPFHATFDLNGSPTGLYATTSPAGYSYSATSFKHTDGSLYLAENFYGQIELESFKATSFGKETDVYITHRQAAPMVSDVSDATFIVHAPVLSIDPALLLMQETLVKQQTVNEFKKRLCNTSKYRVKIKSTSIDGLHAKDFVLAQSVNGITLDPNECLDVTFRFRPSAAGIRNATFNVRGDCNTLVTAALEGKGIFGCDIDLLDSLSLVDIKVGDSRTQNTCLLTNRTSANMQLTARIEPPGTGFNFTPKGPVTLIPNQCFTASITFDASQVMPGTYHAQIVYDLPLDCGVVTTELLASVIDTVVIVRDTIVTIGSIDWGMRRIGTLMDSVLYIVNRGDDDVFVESVRTGNVSSDIALIGNAQAWASVLLRRADSLPINVRFSPQSRSAQALDIIADIRGQQTPVKGLAKGQGYLPAISGSGDSWPSTPVLSLAPKVGAIVIRNTDAVTPLRIGGVDMMDGSQTDFRLKMPAALSFPCLIMPDSVLSIPVEFTPQDVGTRTQYVRIRHDAAPGPEPLPVFADTIVELAGIGEAGRPLDPLAFRQTLTCDTSVASFWLRNESLTESMLIVDMVESDPDAAFELVSTDPITIPANDSAACSVRFVPSSTAMFVASIEFVSTKGIRQHVQCTGEGITTIIRPRLVTVQEAIPGSEITVPLIVQPYTPYFTRELPMHVEIAYTKHSISFVDSRIEPYGSVITNVDGSTPGRVTFDISGSVQQNITLLPRFRSLLAADTTADISASVASGYRCVTGDTTQAVITFARPCAGISRVISLGNAPFALEAPYPTPATDKVSVSYSLGSRTSTSFEVFDALGDVVSRTMIAEQPSGEFALDLVTQSFAAGTYVLRMTSGHYTQSRTFSVVR